jgi:ubiquinone biosynthesis protein
MYSPKSSIGVPVYLGSQLLTISDFVFMAPPFSSGELVVTKWNVDFLFLFTKDNTLLLTEGKVLHSTRKRLFHAVKRRSHQVTPFSVVAEVFAVLTAILRSSVVDVPSEVCSRLVESPASARPPELAGEILLRLVDDLGPVYGKAGQMILQRLNPEQHEVAERFGVTRLYRDWPPLPFVDVRTILDNEVPGWRQVLAIDPTPLGVASMAQVHAATTPDGRQWVVKILKPKSVERLLATVAAIDQLAEQCKPLAVTRASRRFIREINDLTASLRRETSLLRERETIRKVREKLGTKRQKTLAIPQVLDEWSTDRVLVVERFFGTSLADIISGKVEVSLDVKQRLAKSVLSDLLVQVFELGLFHADPHAGNLILMEHGVVGLFDWGLSGELLEADRRHIAGILKSVLALDFDGLVAALLAMAAEAGTTVDEGALRGELKALADVVKSGATAEGEKPSLRYLFETCLASAERLAIPLPDGLLMMAKSLVTIEGLAKGIDPNVPLTRVAAPHLFKAAKPSIADLYRMGTKLPNILNRFFKAPKPAK